MDYYAILNVDRSCTLEQIKQAFFKLAKVHHPDKGGKEEEFKKINEAYQWLKLNHGQVQNQPFQQMGQYSVTTYDQYGNPTTTYYYNINMTGFF